MKAGELKSGEVYWDVIHNEPIILIDKDPIPELGYVMVDFHPSTGRCREVGHYPLRKPSELRKLSSLERELL